MEKFGLQIFIDMYEDETPIEIHQMFRRLLNILGTHGLTFSIYSRAKFWILQIIYIFYQNEKMEFEFWQWMEEEQEP